MSRSTPVEMDLEWHPASSGLYMHMCSLGGCCDRKAFESEGSWACWV